MADNVVIEVRYIPEWITHDKSVGRGFPYTKIEEAIKVLEYRDFTLEIKDIHQRIKTITTSVMDVR